MKIFSTLLMAAVLIVAGKPAQAASFTPTQTQSHNFATLTDTHNFTFDGFDSNLGTLTDVHLTLTIDAITLNNEVSSLLVGPTPVGTPEALTATATTTASGPAGLFIAIPLTTPGFVGNVFFGVQIVGTVSDTGLTNSATLLAPPTDLSAYIGGANSVAIALSSSGTQGGSVPQNVFTGNSGNSSVTVELYYSYDARGTGTPEPASMALMGSALVGLGLLGRKKFAR